MHSTDPTGAELPPFDPRAYARALRAVSFLRHWFDSSIEGLHNIPAREGGMIVTNHGHFGIDLPVLLSLVLDGTGRAVRALGDRLVFAAPFFREWAHMMGAVEGEPDTAIELLQDDQLVLVYPGGAKEALCDAEDAYRLQWESSLGFIRTALRAQKPVIPVAGIGNEELYVQVVPQERVRQSGIGHLVSRLLGEKYVFPVYMGLGPLPFPSDLHYLVGEPMYLPYGPDAAEDEEIVAQLHREVTDATQTLIDRGLRERQHPLASAGRRAEADTDADADTVPVTDPGAVTETAT